MAAPTDPSTLPSDSQEISQNTRLLNEFAASESKDTAPLLKLITQTARDGHLRYPWPAFRKLLLAHLNQVISEYVATTGKPADVDGESFDQRLQRAIVLMNEFEGPPFTLQRLCELLCEPKRFYRNTSKYFQAVSKLVYGITARSASSPAEDYAFEAAAETNSAIFRSPLAVDVDYPDAKPVPSNGALGAGGLSGVSTVMPGAVRRAHPTAQSTSQHGERSDSKRSEATGMDWSEDAEAPPSEATHSNTQSFLASHRKNHSASTVSAAPQVDMFAPRDTGPTKGAGTGAQAMDSDQ